MSLQRLGRRAFLQSLGAGAALAAVSPARAADARPNILWITAEDFSPDLGCYGHPLVQSPNIDRLAAEGARYDNAFTAAPVCSASRSGFMTSMYQTSIRAHQHRTLDKKPLPGGAKPITSYFREAGYFTCNVTTPAPGVKGTGKTDWNFTTEEKPFDGKDWNERKPGQPFFAHLNFSETHRSFGRDPERPIDPEKVEIPPYYPDHPVVRRDWADYLEDAQLLDNKVGAVLKRLEDEGIADNTIIFFFGDHGQAHVRGKQWLYEGGIRVPLIIRWPGHVEAGSVRKELVSAIDFGPTSMTMAGITPPAHLQGRTFWGPGAVPREYIYAARDRCDGTSDRIRCVRDTRYKYIKNFHPERPYMQLNAYKWKQYPTMAVLTVLHEQGKLTPAQELFMADIRPEEELYDLQADPHEINNLAKDSAHQATLKRFRALLENWIAETGDCGETPEDPGIAESEYQKMLQTHNSYLDSLGLPHEGYAQGMLEYWEKKLF